MRRALALLALATFACAVEPPPRPPAPPADEVLLRARLEALLADPNARVLGAALASPRALAALYARRGQRLAWTMKRARADLLRAIRESAAEGLEPEDYGLAALERACADLEPGSEAAETRVDCDLLQSDALARLVLHLGYGKVDPDTLAPRWELAGASDGPDAGALLEGIVASDDLYARIEAQRPRHELYTRLRDELARQRALAARGGPPLVPPGGKLALGARGPRVAALRARLGLAAGSDAYDAALEEAVKAFQASRGLDIDGAVGAATLAALDRPSDDVIAQIRVNLERCRWYLHDLAPTFLAVNIAGFQAYYLRDSRVIWSARAIIGKPFRETPVFRARMTYLVLNPTWTVPPTILQHDMLPELRRDPGFLARKHLEVVDGSGHVVEPGRIDWKRMTAKSFPYELVQPPGPENPLGRIKFMFPNRYSVYLHDTPSRALFERSERAFSSGCIRVEHPLELATLLLEGQGSWDRAALDAAIATGETRTVNLARPVPVLVAYWTAWVGGDGVFQTRGDVYLRDPDVLRALDARFVPRG